MIFFTQGTCRGERWASDKPSVRVWTPHLVISRDFIYETVFPSALLSGFALDLDTILLQNFSKLTETVFCQWSRVFGGLRRLQEKESRLKMKALSLKIRWKFRQNLGSCALRLLINSRNDPKRVEFDLHHLSSDSRPMNWWWEKSAQKWL